MTHKGYSPYQGSRYSNKPPYKWMHLCNAPPGEAHLPYAPPVIGPVNLDIGGFLPMRVVIPGGILSLYSILIKVSKLFHECIKYLYSKATKFTTFYLLEK